MNSSSNIPSYYLNLYSIANQKLTNNNVTNITMNVYPWKNNENTPILTSIILYSKGNQSWFLDGKKFMILPNGQYYFTLTITTSNQTTLYGLTFLLNNHNNSTEMPITYQIILAAGIVVAIPSILILKRKRNRK